LSFRTDDHDRRAGLPEAAHDALEEQLVAERQEGLRPAHS
jgi:hypothetical protein